MTGQPTSRGDVVGGRVVVSSARNTLSLLFCALGIAADSIDDWLLVWCVACGAHVSVRWCSGTVVWSHASAAAGSEEEVGSDDLDLTLGGVSCRGGEFTG